MNNKKNVCIKLNIIFDTNGGMELVIPQIGNTFTNIKGQTFENVREIAFKKDELFGNLGKFVAESKHEVSKFGCDLYDSHPGVYIYQTYENPNIAYRIYKEFAEYNFNGYGDDKLIQRLSEKQKDILMTQFPTGVITLEKRIIGQEIPFYPTSITLLDYINKNMNLNPFGLYMKILQILYELFENGITYLDIHPKNFMIDLLSLNINIIDFDLHYIQFDDRTMLQRQLNNYKRMINVLNEILNIIGITGNFIEVSNYDECFEQLNEMSKRLKKRTSVFV